MVTVVMGMVTVVMMRMPGTCAVIVMEMVMVMV